MPRTRKHKYGRKLIHKKRTASRNKIKRKMKMKSRKIKQKFKKSHMRYTKNGMKRRFQKGGAVGADVVKLMDAYMSPQTSEELYRVTLDALRILGFPRSDRDIELFQELLTTRDVFGEEKGLPLVDILLLPTQKLITESYFSINEKKKYKDGSLKSLRMLQALENWPNFIKQAYEMLHPKESNIDQGDIQLLRIRSDIIQGKMDAEKKGSVLRDMYASLLTEMLIFIEANKHAPRERKPIEFFELAPPESVRSAIPPIPRINLVLSDLARIEVNKQYLTKKNKKDVLNVERIPNHILEKYLEYRLSDDRTGVRFGDNQEQINRFNQKIMAISTILSGHVDGNIDIRDYTQGISNGKNLFLLLHHYGLIPVYTENKDLLRSDQNGRYDYVDDDRCSKSVSGKDFTKSLFSSVFTSGKSHCRTCGRCMNTEDTSKREEGGYKVCIQCYDLFNPSKQPIPLSSREPGGVAAVSSSPPPLRLSSPGSSPRSPSPPLRLSSLGAAAVSSSPPRSSLRSSSPEAKLPPRMTDAQRRLQKLIDEGL